MKYDFSTDSVLYPENKNAEIYIDKNTKIKADREAFLLPIKSEKRWYCYARYPKEAQDKKIEGKVEIGIEIDSVGKSTYTVLKSVHPSLDKEALRVAKSSEENRRWLPAKKGGVRVKSYLIMPFDFSLKED